MAYYNDRYIPDHLRLTGVTYDRPPAPPKSARDPEMKEIRELEAKGIVKVDNYTIVAIKAERSRGESYWRKK